jgi:predicted  nucleic acid-binding Zn-ribbon protein
MDPKKQSEVLKQLVGLDFGVVDARQKRLFDNRTDINRQGKAAKATLDSMIRHKDAPDKGVSVDDLGKEFQAAIDHNHKIETALDEFKCKSAELAKLEEEVGRLRIEVEKRQRNIGGYGEKIDTEQISLKIGTADSNNSKVRDNKQYDHLDKEVRGLRTESQSLSQQMADIESKKASALANADFPVEGLSIGEDAVEFEDIPFDQCSTAQKIRISVAIGLATNPKLRILLVREGSLLDENNLAMIAKMADEADAQIWLEKVGRGSECTVILEDGSIVESEVSSV